MSELKYNDSRKMFSPDERNREPRQTRERELTLINFQRKLAACHFLTCQRVESSLIAIPILNGNLTWLLSELTLARLQVLLLFQTDARRV